MKQNKKAAVAIVAVMALSGCVSMSGYDAKSEFACKAPDGVLCESMSGIYANAEAHNLPGQRGRGATKPVSTVASVKSHQSVMTTPIYSGTPIRSAPRVLRVWFGPWEDTDGDLHDQSYVYLPIDGGRWLIEHNQRRIRDTYQPVRPPANWNKPQTGSSQAGQGRAGTDRTLQEPASRGEAMGEHSSIPEGVHQERMSPEQAAQLMSGIVRPGGAVQENE